MQMAITNGRSMTAAAVLLMALAAPALAQLAGGGNLAAQAGWVRFRIVGGRITASSAYFGQGMSSTSTSGDRQESLSVSQVDGELVLQYELSTRQERSTISMQGGGVVTARRVPQGDSTDPFVEFTQESGRLSRLVLGQGDSQRVLEAPTLWHLALADPAAARQQLAPLLELIQAWPLVAMLDDVEKGLLRAAAARQAPDRRLWATLVADLASHRFAVRQTADRKLRAAGTAIVPYLRSLDPATLDAEQRLRIERIIATLAGGDESDTPERVADWLAWDPQLWFLLLGREDEPTRRLAAEQLRLLLDEPIDFDPAAEPAVRQAQIEQLRPRFAPGMDGDK